MPNFEVKADYGTLGSRNDGSEIRLTLTSWHGKAPQWDLRKWNGEIAKNGICLNDEMMTELKKILNSIDTL